MTVTTTAPATVDELMPAAREATVQEGRIPSKDALMKAFRIGRPKAIEIYERLQAEARMRVRQRRARRAAARPGGPRPWIRHRTVRAPSTLPGEPAPKVMLPQVTQPAEGVPSVPDVALPAAPAKRVRMVKAWPLVLLALPAFVAIWAGWVDLGRLTGFGVVHPLPGIVDEAKLNIAITLPIGLETYGTFALYVWLSGSVPARARRFAMWSAIGSLVVGALGQVAYHLMIAAGMAVAPWQITTAVACLPVAVLGMGAALYHLVHAEVTS